MKIKIEFYDDRGNILKKGEFTGKSQVKVFDKFSDMYFAAEDLENPVNIDENSLERF